MWKFRDCQGVICAFFMRFPLIRCKLLFFNVAVRCSIGCNELCVGMREVTEPDRQVRLDKWLWAARFFKTRTLASQAVNGGKVQVNDSRARSSRIVQLGNILRIRRGVVEFTITVLGLSPYRRPASEARLLYEESEQSVQLRQEAARMRALLTAGQAMPAKRPDKRDRRKIREFTRKDEEPL